MTPLRRASSPPPVQSPPEPRSVTSVIRTEPAALIRSALALKVFRCSGEYALTDRAAAASQRREVSVWYPSTWLR